MVPPMPPQIHKRLLVRVDKEGLMLRSKENGSRSAQARVLIHWGTRGKVVNRQGALWRGDVEDGEEELELGGIIGIVRLWDGECSLIQ